ncbi:hypothetical protein D3C72_1093710 [compost metagenome]
MHARFGCQQKARSQLRAGRTQAKRGSNPGAIRDAAGCNHRKVHALHRRPQQHLGGDLFRTGVPASLQPDRDHAIDAGRLGFLGMDRAGNDL